jgi:hypothetical protein
MATEHLPGIASAGLFFLVVLVVVLPQLRDDDVVGALEAASSSSTSTPDVQPPASGSQPSGPRAASSERQATVTSTAPAEAEEAVDDEMIDKATTVAELEALRKRAPKSPRLLKKLARTQAAQASGLKDALITVRSLVAASPKAAEDKDILQIVTRAASGQPDAQDLAFELMSSGLGGSGPDRLYELTLAPSVSKSVKDRANAALKEPDTKQLMSPALSIAVRLRDAQPCARKELFAEAEKSGDKRSLNYLTPLQPKDSCGNFIVRKDCYPCLGDRAELNAAVTAINGR